MQKTYSRMIEEDRDFEDTVIRWLLFGGLTAIFIPFGLSCLSELLTIDFMTMKKIIDLIKP